MKSITVILCFFILLINSASTQIPPTEACLSKEEQLLYSLLMDYRKNKGLPSIPNSVKLNKVARTHARDLVEHYQFDPDNKCNPHSWSNHGEWTSCCYTSDHKQASCMWAKPKEIADYDGNGYEIAYYSSIGASAKEGLEGWKRSPGHNPLIVNSGIWSKVKWRAIGIAIYKEYGIVWFGENSDDSISPDCDQE